MKIFRRRNVLIGLAVIIIAGITVWLTGLGDEEVKIRTTTVARSSVVQDVVFTGRLESREDATLGFAVSGQVAEVSVNEGDVIAAGTSLVRLDSRTAALDSSKALADRASAQEQSRITWDKTKLDRDNTKSENSQKIEEQKQVVRDKKAELDQALSAWQTRQDDEGEDSYLAKVAYSAYLAARSIYNGAQEDLTTLRKTVSLSNDAAKKAVTLAEEQHVSTKQAAGNVAGLSSLQALENRASVALSQYSLTAPFSGTVTDVAIKKGEYATAGSSLVRIETIDQLEIVSEITETDAIKLANGMTATVTLDALPPTESWEATVSFIAPSADIIEGVPVYEVRLSINMTDTVLKPGLTANVTVHADARDNVLAIPRRAVNATNGTQFVVVIGSDGYEEERKVTTGLTGSDGTIEITGGLSEGDEVLVTRQGG